MGARRVNRISGRILIALSFVALLTVITGYFQAPQPDEGTGAHIFQLSIVALVPTLLVFLSTADWKQPWQSSQPLAISAAAVAIAFAALYCLEHVWYVRH
jgi:hypothetical protein